MSPIELKRMINIRVGRIIGQMYAAECTSQQLGDSEPIQATPQCDRRPWV